MDLRDVKEFFKDSLVYIVCAVLVFFTVVYVVGLQMVSGPSMEPNYQSQDILLLNKFHYRLFKPKRFQVIATQDRNRELLIKRIVGMPGEHIKYVDNKLYVNGKHVEENFRTGSDSRDFDLEFLEFEKIPEGYYFVMGDNRAKSSDSRNPLVGLINKDDFIGKVAFRLWRTK